MRDIGEATPIPSHHDRMLPDGTLLAVIASVTTALGIAGIAVVLLRALV
ncbi:hypothetical protein [Microbacterium sp. WCS2018Hpa-23]|nr:hypothetical protein [Microbacterium sp. WCS2018Hpa-23]